MSRRSVTWVSVAGVALAAVTATAVVAPVGAASAGSTSGTASAAPASSAAGLVTLVDDTNALTVDVPAAWTDVDTTPGSNDDGTPMAWISASTDFAAYRQGFDVPGMVYIGVTYTTDLQSWIDRLDEPQACGAHRVEPYDDGAFVGLDSVSEQCGPAGTATLRTIAANVGDDTTRTYVVQIQSPTAADLVDVDPILASFNAVGITSTAAPGAAAEDAAPPAPGGAVLPPEATPATPVILPDGSELLPALPPGAAGTPTTAPASTATAVFAPTNVVAEGAVKLVDDTRTISVAVPPDWVQSSTTPDSAGLPQIVASPDLATFGAGGATSFAVPGVRYVATPFAADTAATATAAAAGTGCTAAAPQQYQDPVFTGHVVQLTSCGGTATRAYVVAGNPASQTLTALVYVQVTDIDDSDLQTILSTFTFDPAAPVPGTATTVVPAGPTTTLAPPVTTVAPAPSVFSPTAAAPADTVAVVDDTGFLRVGVPPSWAQHLTSAGGGAPGLAASTDLAAFLGSPSTYSVPGVLYQAAPYTADTAALVQAAASGHACTPGLTQQYVDSVFSGTIQELTGCGGTTSRVFVLAASPADSRFTALLTIVVTDDPTVLNTVVATFNYNAAVTPA